MLSKISFKNRFLGVSALSLLFQGLFWEENLSINLLIFSVVLGTISLYLDGELWKNKKIISIALGAFSALCCIVLHHTTLAFFAFFCSLCIWLGFMIETKLKLLFVAFLSGIIKPFFIVINTLENLTSEQNLIINIPQKTENPSHFYRNLRFWIIPVFICFIFFLAFKAGNHIFDKITNDIGIILLERFLYIFYYISLERVPTMLLGALIVIIIFSKIKNNYFDVLDIEGIQIEKLSRIRQKSVGIPGIYLKYEYWVGIFTLILVNVLIFCVNLVDFLWLWMSFDAKNIHDFAQMVHDGTYILIFTVLLSMGILMYFFRKNLNFLPNNNILIVSASLWLLQNIFMVLSVGLRTWYYILERGLAYKRIGVLVFLVLTLFGIITLYLKITQKKTFYFLWRTNMIAVYIILILTSWVNWDNLIAKYNFSHAQNKNFTDFDIWFALTLNNSALPIIQQNWHKIPKEIKEKPFYKDNSFMPSNNNHFYTIEKHFQKRLQDFRHKKSQKSWLSWNYAEDMALKNLK